MDGDPTRNIFDLRKVALVLKEGKAYYPSEVYEALGIKAFCGARSGSGCEGDGPVTLVTAECSPLGLRDRS